MLFTYNVCINTKTWYAYPTGNSKYESKLGTPTPENIRQALYEACCSPNPKNENYSAWSATVVRDGIENFFVVSVKSESQSEAKALAKKLIADNGWTDVSIKTYPTASHTV